MKKEISISNTEATSLLVEPLALKETASVVKNRLLPLSPTVKAGLERECTKEDFNTKSYDDLIGEGSYGQVYRVIHFATSKVYAIKSIDKQYIIDNHNVEMIKREVEIMYKLNHPNIIRLINHFEDDEKIYLILPYAEKGQLYSLLKLQGRFDEILATKYIWEMIEVVRYLHSFSPKIVHRDIKPENILLDKNHHVMLSDFGLANFLEKGGHLTTICGSSEYNAPEVLKGLPYDHRVDIWAIGVLFFELLAGYTPFRSSDHDELINNIKKRKINWPRDFPPLAKNLISKILKLDPKERLTLEEIKEHAWFKQHGVCRQSIVVKEITKKERLESHLINPLTDKIEEKIDDYLKPGDVSIYNSPKKKFLKSNSKHSNSSFSLVDSLNNSMNNGLNNHTSLSSYSNFHSCSLLGIRNARRTSKFAKDEIKGLRQEISTKKGEIEKLKKDSEEKEEKISSLEKKIYELTDDLDSTKSLLEEKTSFLTEAETKITEKDDVISKLKTTILSHELEISSLNSKNASLSRERDSQNEQISKMSLTIKDLTRKREDYKAKYENEIMLKNIEEETRENQVLPIRTIIDLLMKSFRDIRQNFSSQIEVVDQNITELKKKQKNEVDTQRDYLLKKINAVNELINDYRSNMLSSIEETMSKVKQIEIEKKEKTIKYLEEKNEELLKDNTELKKNEADINLLKSQIKTLEEKNQILSKKISLNEKMWSMNRERKNTAERKYMDIKYQVQNIKRYISENSSVSSSQKMDEMISMINQM